MIVTFISQCEKKAIPRTRRVLDAFADRIGDNTWQTVITEDGLLALKRLLKKTVTKNTAISCHWIRGRRRSELMWIVGNRNKFNSEGIVPVNRTQKSLQPWKPSHLWQNLEIIALASSMAGLFHDFGKASDLFQAKISPVQTTKNYEPYRHEWVSLKLFEAFVIGKTDQGWLTDLLNPQNISETSIINYLNTVTNKENFYDSFKLLKPFAQLVGWLIISHHRLPIYPYFDDNPPSLGKLENAWLTEFDIKWNSPSYIKHEWTSDEKIKNWNFSNGLPFASSTWQNKAKELARRAQRQLVEIEKINWQEDLLTSHVSRLVLMLSDHWYSAQEAPILAWQDESYLAYANTDKNRQLKQKLDEHNVGVAHHAYLNSRLLPKFLNELPELGINQVLQKGIANGNSDLSAWQNKAFKLSQKVNIRSNECGFFGINMASTGQGKTIANARIMYGLADGEKGCRFSIALGLRALTTQTGMALTKNLDLNDYEIATLIGSMAIQRLLTFDKDNTSLDKQQKQLLEDLEKTELALRGSESLEQGTDDFQVEYPNIEPDSLLKTWFEKEPKLQKLLHAPILVSTIDHLMPATESVRGGRQIAPMLRLLSSDLILDEPDEFGLEDLPALTRLVNWAGMLGAKVLLSSATIPPAMAFALFESYNTGRQIYNRCMSGHAIQKPIVCAWFDEFSSKEAEISNAQEYGKTHIQFIQHRIKKLLENPAVLRKGKIVDIVEGENILQRLTKTLLNIMYEAHQNNHQKNQQSLEISLGVIRFANINPLVAITNSLIEHNVVEDTYIHYCVYHSQFTLAQRSNIEEKLDRLLNRKESKTIWQHAEIKTVIEKYPHIKRHLFVVLATSVCEVGRDHDYDWAIAEPSSMRSLIQLAGRLQRHRKQTVSKENLFILNLNIRALQGKEVVFTKPGFEGNMKSFRCIHQNKEIKNLLSLKQYQHINAIPSIEFIKPSKQLNYDNLVTLEQNAYAMILLGANDEKNNARVWWRNPLSWCGEMQRQQPFRKSTADSAYYLKPDQKNKLAWFVRDEINKYEFIPVNFISTFNDLSFGQNSDIWFDNDETKRYTEISELLDIPLERVYLNYGEVRLSNRPNQQYVYHRFLGVFSEIEL
ncbi:type I-F CRISPR-associated helicase Cas3f [Acinetobacter soli]|uniref:type I-F CRISPR-associated helicase Cas3f n=1 Tax=Acinetobacter soli TaxID=487316 RepID=UPI002582FD9C|nr:type I-F CRISPR-associated helicase Cas3f [uncultured Acinetobacter sp.]